MLKVAGALSAVLVLFHIVIIFVGAPGYRYFGAGEEIARLAEQGSPVPALITLGVSVVFAVFAAYGFSGAAIIRRLPLLRSGLFVIGGIYTLRGLVSVPVALALLGGASNPVLPRELVFSLVSLGIGMVYLLGLVTAWASLKPGIGGPSGSHEGVQQGVGADERRPG